ncbi:MAG TPA: hypothetical protein DDY71_03040 [Spirochaetia bacterium]|nr:hypothetical protein [Spirochaetia bacterium]HBI36599.1 hypothetical protein [Spirochaetia bacterium]
MGDIYDKENFDASIFNLKSARELNESDPKKAFEHLDKSRKMSQEAYYNAFKKRSLEKKAEAEILIADAQSTGSNTIFADLFKKGTSLYDEGIVKFSEENYTQSFALFSESVDTLKELKANRNKIGQEYESKIKYIQDLIKKAEQLGADTHAPQEIQIARDNLQSGIEAYREPNLEKSTQALTISEENALKSIDLTNKALKELKRIEARSKINAAGKSVEKAAGKEVIDNEGQANTGLDYKFEFDEDGKGDIKNAPDNVSYKDVLLKAVEYIEKAKEAYFNEDYDMAIRYADIAKRIAESYTAGGIKTHYTVRLITEKRDCLWRIAEYSYIYGNPFYWPMIWKTNKEKILNPDLIFPGQVFAIPELD